MATNLTVREICYQWLAKAFREGQKSPPFTCPSLLYHNWSEAMEQELAEAAEQKEGISDAV